MNIKFKFITTISILITLLFSNVVFADDIEYINGPLKFKIADDNSIIITEYYGDDETVKVPMAIGPYKVTAIADGAFTGTNIKEVQLPNTITSISSDAFDNVANVSIEYFDEEEKIIQLDDDPMEYHIKETQQQIDEVKTTPEDSNLETTQELIDGQGFQEEEASLEDFIDENGDTISEEDDINNISTHESDVDIDSGNKQSNNSIIEKTEKSFKSNTITCIAAIAILVFIAIFIIVKKKHK